ncbi:hypothetical protein DFH05DRAFT_1233914 [Lentinula detonsa]|uniref:Uncharacterized protein n=1 Tax=Lentinula detonsa TaxID=2804962 RepID=A0A9W8NYV5_9AGAR|nr:hypothetical protein DFH05DRAFT_1233914 [Lentinula detonsa]
MPSYPYPYPYPYPYSLPHPSPIPVPPLAASTETPTQPRKRGRPKSKANGSAVVATSNPSPRKEWSNEELDKLYDYMLGEAADARFEKLQVASNKIWKEVAAAKIFDGWTATQLQTKWESSLATFKKLYAFRTFTGRGADADDYDWDDEEAVSTHLSNSHNKGCDIEGLNARTCQLWVKHQWYDLFVKRYHDNPRIAREVPRSSADALSDFDPVTPDAENDDVEIINTPQTSTQATANSTLLPVPSSSSLSRTSSSELTPQSRTQNKGKGRSGVKDDRLSGLTTYFETKAEVDKGVLKLREKEANYKKLSEAYEKAANILDNPDKYDFRTLEAANKVTERYFKHILLLDI